MQMRLIAIAAIACCQAGLSGCASVAAVAAAHPAAVAAAADLLPVAAMAGGIGLAGLAGIAGHQGDKYEPGTLGAFLDVRQAAAEAAAKSAMQQNREIAIGAALQASRAIMRARIALREQLNRRQDALDGAAGSTVSAIESVLAGIAKGTNAAAAEAGEKARILADRLEVPAQVPQVRSFGPLYLFPFLPFQTLTVRGAFPDMYPEGALPRLTINGRSFEAYSYDTQSLAFSLPTSALGPPESPVPVWSRAGLSIPWDAPRFDTFAQAGQQNFVVVGLLPNSPGRATIEHRVKTTRTEEVTRKSDAFSLGADAGELEQTACLSLTPGDLADGWRLKPGSAAPVFPAQAGAGVQDLGRQSEDDRSVCWRVRLDAVPAGQAEPVGPDRGSAALWSISAVLRRDVVEAKTTTESFDLAWGSNRVFAFPQGTWTLRYAKYGGDEIVFTGPDRSNPLFRVDADARSVRVSAYPF